VLQMNPVPQSESTEHPKVRADAAPTRAERARMVRILIERVYDSWRTSEDNGGTACNGHVGYLCFPWISCRIAAFSDVWSLKSNVVWGMDASGRSRKFR